MRKYFGIEIFFINDVSSTKMAKQATIQLEKKCSNNNIYRINFLKEENLFGTILNNLIPKS